MARQSWVYVNGVAIPKDQYIAPVVGGTMIMPDIKEYKSMQTGERITSRSRHREHLRKHNLIEIGNEKIPVKKIPDVPGLRQEIERNYR